MLTRIDPCGLMEQICQTAFGLVIAGPGFITALRATKSHLEETNVRLIIILQFFQNKDPSKFNKTLEHWWHGTIPGVQWRQLWQWDSLNSSSRIEAWAFSTMTVAPEEVKVHFFNIRLTQIMWTSGIISINIRTRTQHYSFIVLIVWHAHGTQFVNGSETSRTFTD